MLYISLILATLAILALLWEVKLKYDEQKASPQRFGVSQQDY